MSVELIRGQALEVLRSIPDASFDSCVTDPPYGLRFMGKRWDYQVPSVDLWREVLRVIKPGAYLLSFGGARTSHRLACNVEDSGFELVDTIEWLYGTGKPKSKGLLKPAHEPILVARSGVGGLQIESCRLQATANENRNRHGESSREKRYTERGGTNFSFKPGPRGGSADGRWPTNVILTCSCEVEHEDDDCPVRMIDEQSGHLKAGGDIANARPRDMNRNAYGKFYGGGTWNSYGDSGGASRFFYCAKASPSERGAFNKHPTVKPIALMRHLVRLATPPGGRVLDCFLGSGTTAIACRMEGFSCVGVERDAESIATAQKRLAQGVLEFGAGVSP